MVPADHFNIFDIASSFWAVDGGNLSANDTAYSLIRAFQDNVVNPDVTVTNPSQTGANQQIALRTVFTIRILPALSPGGGYEVCSGWLTGASGTSVSQYMITGLLNPPAYRCIAHIQRTCVRLRSRRRGYLRWDPLPGVPPNFAMTVNDQGLFLHPKVETLTRIITSAHDAARGARL